MRKDPFFSLCSRVVLACLLALTLPAAWAQNITGSVTGTVTDAGGADLPNAKVSVTNIATGVVVPTQTNASGVYSLRFLPIGQYKVSVEAAGFQTSTTGSFTLEVAQEARIDVKMSVGQISQNVTVTSAAAILNAENAITGDTITAKTASEMPLQGRNFSSLTLLAAGAVTPNPNAQNSVKRSSYNGGYFQNGNREQTNNYTLDGADINESIDNYIGYSPNVDALGEVKVITGNATAEYGNANGGQVVMVTKSGTNKFHGDAFWFLENQNLNADSWANKHNTLPSPTTPFNRSIFGGTLGGPIKRDKLFFFIDYQGARQHTSTVTQLTVPTAAMRLGQYGITNSNGSVTVKTAAITNPVARYLFAHPELYPLPNTTGIGTNPFLPVNNYVNNENQFVTNNQGDAKVDWQVRSNDLISGRFSIGREYDGNTTLSIPTEIPVNNDNPYTGFIVNWTHTFSPNVVSEARAGVGRTRYIALLVDLTNHWGLTGDSQLGIPGAQGTVGISGFGFSGDTSISTIGPAAGGTATDSIVNAFTYGDVVSWQLGRHTLKFGGQALRYQQNRYYSGNDGALGQFTYNGQYTGSGYADFLTNQSNFYGQGASSGTWGQRQWRDALFIQDDFKATPNLTLNMGMRWEYDQPLYEVNNKQSNINIETGAITFAGQNGASRALYKPFYGGFMPRLGFAYSPERFNGKFVVRGGYAITNFLEGTGANLRLTLNPPFFIDSSANSGAGPGFLTNNGFPRPANADTFSGNVRAWQPNLRPALTQQFNLSTETQLTNQASLTIAYLGQNGNHLVDPREGNQRLCPSCPLPVSSLPGLGLVSQVSYTESEATMNYNALQVTGRERTSNGLEFLANYTFSKSLSNNLGYYGAGGVSSQSAYWQNAYDGGGDYGPAFFDATHIFSFSSSYDLPFGRGKLFGSNMNRVADLAVGGWKLGAIASVHTGFPVTLSSTEHYFVNQRTDRANHYANLKVRNRSVNQWFGNDPTAVPCATDTNNNTCAYGEESSSGFGTARVGSERAPGYQDFDLAASKGFAITEGTNLQFRADMFNILNTTSLGNPSNNVSTPATFGQITNTNSTERQIQLALKLVF